MNEKMSACGDLERGNTEEHCWSLKMQIHRATSKKKASKHFWLLIHLTYEFHLLRCLVYHPTVSNLAYTADTFPVIQGCVCVCVYRTENPLTTGINIQSVDNNQHI